MVLVCTLFVTFSSCSFSFRTYSGTFTTELHSKSIPLTKLKQQLIFNSEGTSCHFPKFVCWYNSEDKIIVILNTSSGSIYFSAHLFFAVKPERSCHLARSLPSSWNNSRQYLLNNHHLTWSHLSAADTQKEPRGHTKH